MSEEKRNDAPSNKGTDQDKSAASASKSASATKGAPKSSGNKQADKSTAAQAGTKSATAGAKAAGADKSSAAKSGSASSAASNTAKPKPTSGSSSAATSGTSNRASGASAAGGTGTPNRPGATAHRSSGGSNPPIIAIVAVVIAVIALAISGWLLYRGEQRLASADSRLDTVEKSVQSSVQDIVMPRLSRFDSRLQSLDSDIGDLSTRVDSRGQTVSQLQQSLESTQTQLAELSDARNDGANRLQLDQIESLLRAANQRLQLYDDPQSATRALEMASDAIARKNDPRLFDIRGEIANEVAALQALPSPDIEGLSLQLAVLIEQVPELPLDSSVPSEYDNQAEQEESSQGSDEDSGMSFDEFQSQFSQGWVHFKNSVGDALSGMMTIRRSDGTQRALLPPDQAFFLNQNLQLELRSARLALLERDTQNYRDSLATARQWLEDYYDTDAAAVTNMRERLDQMSNVKLDWDTPDISRSLVMLEELKSQRGGGQSAGNGAGSNASTGDADNAGAGEQTGQEGA